jgi:hypothetical protein
MLEKRYAAVGARVKIERAAASDEDGTVGFYLDRDDPGREWGARITPLEFQKTRVEVRSIDFGGWFNKFVLTRKIPGGTKRANDSKPMIAMKLDIEGHEKAVLGPLLKLGLLCHIDLLVLEGAHLSTAGMSWAPKFFEEQKTKGCETRIVDMDDEEYGLDGAPWPVLGKDGKMVMREARERWDGKKWPGFKVVEAKDGADEPNEAVTEQIGDGAGTEEVEEPRKMRKPRKRVAKASGRSRSRKAKKRPVRLQKSDD